MDEPMVTIPLGEYNRLRDEANMNRIVLDKIAMYESRMMILEQKIYDLEQQKRKS